MKTNRLISAMLFIAIFMSQFLNLGLIMSPAVVYAQDTRATNIADNFFHDQLDDDAKVFYDIFDKMFFGCDYTKEKVQSLELIQLILQKKLMNHQL